MYVHGAFTEEHSLFFLGARSLESMRDFGILPFRRRRGLRPVRELLPKDWGHIAGHQACLAHILRDYQDAAETYPDAIWPVQAQRALRGLIGAWHAARDAGLPAIPADAADPLSLEFRRAVRAGLAAVPRIPGPKHATAQHPGRDLLEFCSRPAEDDRASGSQPTRRSGRRTIWLHTAPLVVAGEYGGSLDVQVVAGLVVSVWLVGLTFSRGVRGRPDVRWGLRRPERWSSPRRLPAFSVSALAGRAWPGW